MRRLKKPLLVISVLGVTHACLGSQPETCSSHLHTGEQDFSYFPESLQGGHEVDRLGLPTQEELQFLGFPEARPSHSVHICHHDLCFLWSSSLTYLCHLSSPSQRPPPWSKGSVLPTGLSPATSGKQSLPVFSGLSGNQSVVTGSLSRDFPSRLLTAPLQRQDWLQTQGHQSSATSHAGLPCLCPTEKPSRACCQHAEALRASDTQPLFSFLSLT